MAQGCLYYTATEVMELLGVSRAKAHKIVKNLNRELTAKGYIVISDRSPNKYLAEKC